MFHRSEGILPACAVVRLRVAAEGPDGEPSIRDLGTVVLNETSSTDLYKVLAEKLPSKCSVPILWGKNDRLVTENEALAEIRILRDWKNGSPSTADFGAAMNRISIMKSDPQAEDAAKKMAGWMCIKGSGPFIGDEAGIAAGQLLTEVPYSALLPNDGLVQLPGRSGLDQYVRVMDITLVAGA